MIVYEPDGIVEGRAKWFVVQSIAVAALAVPSPTIRVAASDTSVEVSFEERRWVFPRGDCVLLPVANTTAELLADYIAGRLRQAMTARGFEIPRILCVEVEESFGQSATVEWRRDDEDLTP